MTTSPSQRLSFACYLIKQAGEFGANLEELKAALKSLQGDWQASKRPALRALVAGREGWDRTLGKAKFWGANQAIMHPVRTGAILGGTGLATGVGVPVGAGYMWGKHNQPPLWDQIKQKMSDEGGSVGAWAGEHPVLAGAGALGAAGLGAWGLNRLMSGGSGN